MNNVIVAHALTRQRPWTHRWNPQTAGWIPSSRTRPVWWWARRAPHRFPCILLASGDDEGGRDGRLHHGLNHRLRRGHSLPRRTRRLVEPGNLRRRRRQRRRVVNRGQHPATRPALPPAHTQARHRSRGSRRGLRRSRRSLRGVPQAALTPRHDPVHQPADAQQPPTDRTRGDAIDRVFNHPRLGQTRSRPDDARLTPVGEAHPSGRPRMPS